MSNEQIKRTSFIIAFFGALLFSCKAIFIKMAYWYDIDKLSLLVLRMGFALPFYLVFAYKEQIKQPNKNQKVEAKDWVILIVLGIIGYYFASFLDLWGLQYVSAGLERLILFVYPTITTLLAAFIFKRKLTGRKLLAIVLTYFGISLAFWDKVSLGNIENFWLGTGLIFGSALTFSFFLIGSEKLIPKFGSVKFTSYSMIISCLVTILHFGFSSEANLLSFPWEVYAIAIAIATISTVLPSFMMSYAIKNIGASNTAITSSIGPIWVLVLAYFILGESFSYLQLAGTMIVIFGVWLISKAKQKA